MGAYLWSFCGRLDAMVPCEESFPMTSNPTPPRDDTQLLRELARVKAVFQQRAIVAHVTES